MNLLRFPRLLGACLALVLALPLLATPEHWLPEIDALTAHDATQPPPAGGVVFVGSSSIRMWKTLATDFPGIATINRGFGGSELADSTFYFDRIVAPYRPRLVVLFAGTNDVWAGKSAEQVFADFQAFRARLARSLPESRLVFIGLTLSPSRAKAHETMRAANRLIAAACAQDPHCTFVDFNPLLSGTDAVPQARYFREDQLHLNAEGYGIWARALAPYLKP